MLQTNEGKFTYPLSGPVEAADWNPRPECGGGLHGLLWGAGAFDISSYGEQFLLLEVDDAPENLILFGGKCKVKKGEVVYAGDQLGVVNMLRSHPNFPPDTILNYDINTSQYAVSGNGSTQTAGNGSTQTAGYGSIQTAGNGSIQTAGNGSIQTAGYDSIQTAGKNSIQIGWWWDKDGKYCVAHRKINEHQADKPYSFDEGKWKRISEKGKGKRD